MLLRQRELEPSEIGKCYRFIIDDYYVTQLIVLNYYPATNSLGRFIGYNIVEKDLGNIAQIINVIPPPIPSYVNFSPPPSTQSIVST